MPWVLRRLICKTKTSSNKINCKAMQSVQEHLGEIAVMLRRRLLWDNRILLWAKLLVKWQTKVTNSLLGLGGNGQGDEQDGENG